MPTWNPSGASAAGNATSAVRTAKHKKPVPCALRKGTGKIIVNHDGREEERACGRCNGTGTIT